MSASTDASDIPGNQNTSLQEFLAAVEAEFPDLAPSISRLSVEQQVVSKQQYEKRLQNPKPWYPDDEAARRRWVAEIALNFAERNLQNVPRAPAAPLKAALPTERHEPARLCGFSIAVARKLCPADAIVYRYLQEKQIEESANMSPTYNERQGKRWVPGYSAEQIHQELRCFKDAQTVLDSINRLEKANLIETERTGAFVARERRTGRKRDIRMWIHVPSTVYRAEETVWFNPADAMKYGLAKAMLRQLFTHDKQLQNAPATDLAKMLPYSAKSIRSHLKGLHGSR